MMNRKEKILEILKEKEQATVKELANIFKVSEMTIYRDIKELEKEGQIKRKHGIVLLKEDEEEENQSKENVCPICEKTITRAHPYKISVENKTIEACCEHCGMILHKNYENKDVFAITYDFITENPITAFDAFYVVGSSAKPCCSPSVIPFSDKKMAENFVKGFGGKVLKFLEVYEEINKTINLNIKSCCQKTEVFNISQLKKENK
jgi:DeoR/GlpR family transcriptional regulator of sugar metabolism